MKYLWRLKQLNKQYDKEEKPYSELISKAVGEDKQQLLSEAGSILAPIDDAINCLKSSRLCQIANRLIVPIPKRQDETYWEFSYYTQGYYLTTAGYNELRKRIRQERKDSCDLVLKWTLAIVGILGALIGVITVWKN